MINLSSNPSFVSRVDEWKLHGRPNQNAMDWSLDKWTETFPEYRDFLSNLYISRLGNLDRDFLVEVVASENANESYLNGFLAVMIWGYGPDARGPFRTRRIFDQPETLTSVISAAKFLSQGKIDAAFDALVLNGPKHLGTAFATKYLYFAGTGLDDPAPLILDSLVAEGLDYWCGYKIDSQTKNFKNYLKYLDSMNQWAEILDISPRDLEMILFTETARLKGSQSWANRQQINIGDTDSLFNWGALFAAELMLRIPDLDISYTQPGGGQYECISLRSSDTNLELEVDINLVGTIHIRANTPINLNWEDLIQVGPTNAAEKICRYLHLNDQIDLNRASQQALTFRSLVSTLVHNSNNGDFKALPVVIDNSVYGASINRQLLDPYRGLEELFSDEESPLKLLNYWAILIDGEPSRLVDLKSGQGYRTDGTVMNWTWP